MTAERALEIGIPNKQCGERIAAEIERCQEHAANDLELESKRHGIQMQLHRETNLILRRELQEATAWYRDPVFVAITSAIVTTAVLFGARSLIVQ